MTLQRSAPQAEPVQQLHTGHLADMLSARVPSQSVTASALSDDDSNVEVNLPNWYRLVQRDAF